MAVELSVTWYLLAIIVGTLLGIVYSLRILFALERRIARVEVHIEHISQKILGEEKTIERAVLRRKKRSRRK